MTPLTADDVRRLYAEAADVPLDHAIYGPSTPQHGGYIAAPMPYYRLLAGLCRARAARRVLEIGTHFGGSTLAMLQGMRAAPGARLDDLRLVTVDVTRLNREVLAACGEVRRVEGSATEAAVVERAANLLGAPYVDLLYIDALKSRDFVATVLAQVTRRIVPGLIVLDDVLINDAMRGLWAELRERLGDRAIEVSAIDESIRPGSVGFGLIVVDPHELPLDLDDARGTPRYASLRAASWGGRDPAPAMPEALARSRPPRELQCLHHLAQAYFRGHGEIVDIGCGLGASTLALAGGLAGNPAASERPRRIHAFDRFTNEGERLAAQLGAEVPPNGSYLPVFLRHLQVHAAQVNAVAVDPGRLRWAGLPIELAVLGGVRTAAAVAQVWTELLMHGLPGETVIVCADFVRPGARALWAALAGLQDHLELIALAGPALILGLRSRPGAADLARLAPGALRHEEQVEHLVRLAARTTVPELGACALYAAAEFALDAGGAGPARQQLAAARARAEAAGSEAKSLSARFARFEAQLEARVS